MGMRSALAATLLACLPGVALAAQSCIETAANTNDFDECARQLIVPLEAKVAGLADELRSRYRNDPELLGSFEHLQKGWNEYRSNRCSAEAAARSGGLEGEKRRAFMACTRRALELRVRELRSLAGSGSSSPAGSGGR
jgi:uncharacterized protein YecT (DUF1311 family)